MCAPWCNILKIDFLHGVTEIILVPVLFTLYINDLPNDIKHSETVLYADNTVLLYSSEKQKRKTSNEVSS